jgi:fatty acid desaturase
LDVDAGSRPQARVERRQPSSARGRAGAQASPGSPDLSVVVAPDGTSWVEFRRTLVPDYARVWRDITLCYVLLFGGYALAILGERALGWPAALALLVPAAVWFGFWLHFLWNFGHESAHWGLSSSRRRNDRLATVFIWIWYGHTAQGYRLFHWQHHRHLGDRRDSEMSYLNCMSSGYLARLATGLALLQAIRFRGSDELLDEPAAARSLPSAVTLGSAARSAVLHLVMVVVPLVLGAPVIAGAWILGAVIVYPSLNIVRQILEHRREDATCADDFTKVDHGPVTHGFGNGWFSRCFGSAGFNRHGLHHWDPDISCTNLPEMEDFLRRAGLAGELDGCERTYWGELRTQLRSARA